MGKSKIQHDTDPIATFDVGPDINGNFIGMNCCGGPDPVEHKVIRCGMKSLDELAREKEAFLRTAGPDKIDKLKRECGKYRLDKAATWIQAFEKLRSMRASVSLPKSVRRTRKSFYCLSKGRTRHSRRRLIFLGRRRKRRPSIRRRSSCPRLRRRRSPCLQLPATLGL